MTEKSWDSSFWYYYKMLWWNNWYTSYLWKEEVRSWWCLTKEGLLKLDQGELSGLHNRCSLREGLTTLSFLPGAQCLTPYHVMTYFVPLASLTLVALATGSTVSTTGTAVQITVAPLDRTPTQECQQRDTLTNTLTFLPIREELMENSITDVMLENNIRIFIVKLNDNNTDFLPICRNRWGKTSNLSRQMVCYTEPSEKPSLETVWKRAGTFKKILAGDWMNHLSIKLLPKPVRRRAKTCFPLRKAFSAVLCSSLNEEILHFSPCHAMAASNHFRSCYCCCLERTVASPCRLEPVTHQERQERVAAALPVVFYFGVHVNRSEQPHRVSSRE